MSRLYIDYNHLCIRSLFADMSLVNDPNPDFKMHKHRVMNSLFYNIKKFRPTEVIIAVDGKNYWRKKIFEDYKAHRKDKRDKDVFPWGKYYDYMDEFTADIKKSFPFKIIRINWVEADDIIGVLSRMLPAKGSSVIVTSDKDYVQLLKHDGVSLYDPMKKEFVEEEDPQRQLDIKIMTGDKSDNIPNIKPLIGEKTAIKLLDDEKALEELLDSFYVVPKEKTKCKHDWDVDNEDESDTAICEKCEMVGKIYSVQENYTRNKRLIDMGCIPKKIQQRILDRYNDCEVNKIGGMDVMKFLMRHKLRKLGEDCTMIHESMKPLMGVKTNKDDMGEFF